MKSYKRKTWIARALLVSVLVVTLLVAQSGVGLTGSLQFLQAQIGNVFANDNDTDTDIPADTEQESVNSHFSGLDATIPLNLDGGDETADAAAQPHAVIVKYNTFIVSVGSQNPNMSEFGETSGGNGVGRRIGNSGTN